MTVAISSEKLDLQQLFFAINILHKIMDILKDIKKEGDDCEK